MSSQVASFDAGPGSDGDQVIVDGEAVQGLLTVLQDEGCRRIIQATGEDALSAKELAETCEMPLSTAYRKVDRLTDAGVLTEQVRIARSGKHTSEYLLRIDDVEVTLGTEHGVSLRVSHTESADAGPPVLAEAD